MLIALKSESVIEPILLRSKKTLLGGRKSSLVNYSIRVRSYEFSPPSTITSMILT